MSEEVSDDDARNSSRTRGMMGVWATMLVLVLYPLSVGPLSLLYERLNLEGTAIGRVLTLIYYPIRMLCDRDRDGWVCKLLEKWAELWTSLTP